MQALLITPQYFEKNSKMFATNCRKHSKLFMTFTYQITLPLIHIVLTQQSEPHEFITYSDIARTQKV